MILLTGAAGYIGSHVWVELLNIGYQVFGVDNFCNSSFNVVSRIEDIAGQKINFLECDIQNKKALNKIFQENEIEAVIHFAALKSVLDSVRSPASYYKNNVDGLLSLVEVMSRFNCRQLVFSSSATVYSSKDSAPPFEESMPLGPTNPYGWTKFVGEQLLRDLELSSDDWRVAYLRYFNPVGAHDSGLIGEDPKNTPSNLMPYISRVAIGKLDYLRVYGGDWPTHDGTGVRDYIHVVDLAKGHIEALKYLNSQKKSITVNLGTGKGYSVLDVIKTFEIVSGRKVRYQIVDRRDGDIAICYANTCLAKDLLGWTADKDIYQMCQDSWRWQLKNPNGF